MSNPGEADAATLNKPRVLCLHGAGVSAEIFRLQMRSFITTLAPYFRLVFAEGPFLCEMHETIRDVYGGMGPCKRWARWAHHHPPIDDDFARDEMEYACKTAMDADKGTGAWVGLMGFSQGAKLSFSILLDTQLRQERDSNAALFAGGDWKFAIVFAARAPPYALSDVTKGNEFFLPPGVVPSEADYETTNNPHLLTKPSLHVHGMLDPELDFHQQMYQDYSDPKGSDLIEWNAGHRLPFKPDDVKLVTDGILKTAKDAGVL